MGEGKVTKPLYTMEGGGERRILQLFNEKE